MMHASSYLQIIIALLTVLGLLWVVSWGIRRYLVPQALRSPSPNLCITGHLPLDMKHRLIELSLNGRCYYIVLGGTQPVMVLGEAGEELPALKTKP
jgi:hypothetical protein